MINPEQPSEASNDPGPFKSSEESNEYPWTLDMCMNHPAFTYLASEIVSWFRANGGTNYVALGMTHPEFGEFELTVRRKHGKTPAEIADRTKLALRKTHEALRKIRRFVEEELETREGSMLPETDGDGSEGYVIDARNALDVIDQAMSETQEVL